MDIDPSQVTIQMVQYEFAPATWTAERQVHCSRINLNLQQFSDLEFKPVPSEFRLQSPLIKKLEDFFQKSQARIPFDQDQYSLLVYFNAYLNFLSPEDTRRMIDLAKAMRGIAMLPQAQAMGVPWSEIRHLLKTEALSLRVFTDGLGNPRANLETTQAQARVLSSALILMGVPASRINAVGMGGLPLPVLPKNAGLPEMQRALEESRRVEIQLKCDE